MCTNSFRKPNFTKPHAKAIEAFHRTLGGHMFKYEKMRNGGNLTCPFISEFKIGLWPSPIATQPNKSSMDSHIICPTQFAKNKQPKH